jgi:hypothetical protein
MTTSNSIKVNASPPREGANASNSFKCETERLRINQRVFKSFQWQQAGSPPRGGADADGKFTTPGSQSQFAAEG